MEEFLYYNWTFSMLKAMTEINSAAVATRRTLRTKGFGKQLKYKLPELIK